TMPGVAVVERDYPNTYARFTALGPLVSKAGIGAKGISWSAEPEVELLRGLNGEAAAEGATHGLPELSTDVQACEAILALSPETNGEVAVRAWEKLEAATAFELRELARPREHEKIRFADLVHQPRKIITAPTWTGIESDRVSYTAYWVNV